MPYQPVTLPPLQGINQDENLASLAPGQLRSGINVARKGNMTGTRPGLRYDGGADYQAALSGTPAVQGIYDLRADKDSTRALVAVAGGEVYQDNTSGALTKTGVTISSGQDNTWTFASYQNNMFAAGGAASDDFWYWDGSAGSISKVTLPFTCQYVFQKWGFLFVSGLTGTTFSDNPIVARYPDYATDATDPTNWKASNAIPGQLLGENPGQGSFGAEYATGFGSYQDNRGDFLLHLTNRRIVAFRQNRSASGNADAFEQTDAIANGCVSQNAFVDLGFDQGDAVYMSEYGIHSIAASQQYGNRVSEFLSWPIRKTFETINRNRLKYAQASYWPTLGIVLFLVSTGSNTSHDLILCMDIKGAGSLSPKTVRWYEWRLSGVTANVITAARDENDVPYIYVGGTQGEVVRFERNAFSDLGSAYNVSMQLRDESFGLPSREKGVGNLFIALQGNGNYSITHQFLLDDGNRPGITTSIPISSSGGVYGTATYGGSTYGTSDSTLRKRIRGAGSGITIGHRFSHGGVDEPFWIGEMTQEVSFKGRGDEVSA